MANNGIEGLKNKQPQTFQWEQPISFYEIDLPPFPVESLPRRLRDYVRALAIASQTPPALPGMVSLSVCSSAVARKVVICVRPGYIEPLNIYTGVVLNPGSRKSYVFAQAVIPLLAFEESENTRLSMQIAEQESLYRVTEKALQQAEARAAKADNAIEREPLTREAAMLAQELAEIHVPTRPRLVADDVTPERLASLVYEQGGRMAVMSSEGGDVFDMMGGRYSSNRRPNLGVYLKGHSGDMLRVDRSGRAEYVNNPAITMALTLQPDALHGLMSSPVFRGRGLLGRFLYAIPPNRLGTREIEAPALPEHIRESYHQTVTQLLRTPYGTDEAGQETPHVLRFADDAQVAFDQFAREIEPQLGPFGALSHMTDWGGKLVGATARLVGIFHMIEHAGVYTPWELPVSKETVEDAVSVARYCIAHARAAYGEMDADPVVADAKYILAWIERGKLESFTKRDAHYGTRGRFNRVTDLEPALQLLTDHEYIRERPEEKRQRPGRKPSPTYDVNPYIHTLNPLNTIPKSVHSVHSVHIKGEREIGES